MYLYHEAAMSALPDREGRPLLQAPESFPDISFVRLYRITLYHITLRYII